MLRLKRPTALTLERMLASARESTPTYPNVGATTGEFPVGYRHDADEIRLGCGEAVFERAVEALRTWQPQIGAGIRIVPDGARVEAEETVVLVLRVGGLWATAPCRVVYVVEDVDRFGFAYGTLPGHPEKGEAAFTIDRDHTGDIRFQVRSFSRPAEPLARLGAPIARRAQRRVTRRYLTALALCSDA